MHAKINAVRQNPIFKSLGSTDASQMLKQAGRMAEFMNMVISTEGESSPLSSVMDMITSGNPEDLDRLREFVSARQKLDTMRKLMFGKE